MPPNASRLFAGSAIAADVPTAASDACFRNSLRFIESPFPAEVCGSRRQTPTRRCPARGSAARTTAAAVPRRACTSGCPALRPPPLHRGAPEGSRTPRIRRPAWLNRARPTKARSTPTTPASSRTSLIAACPRLSPRFTCPFGNSQRRPSLDRTTRTRHRRPSHLMTTPPAWTTMPARRRFIHSSVVAPESGIVDQGLGLGMRPAQRPRLAPSPQFLALSVNSHAPVNPRLRWPRSSANGFAVFTVSQSR